MKSKYLLGLLACFCTAAQAQLVPTYTQEYIESVNAEVEVDPEAFELVETNRLTDPFDLNASKVQRNGLYMLTYSSDRERVTLFKKSGGRWFYKMETDLSTLFGDSASFSLNAIHLLADGSLVVSLDYRDADNYRVSDTGRIPFNGKDYLSFESFELDTNLEFDQISLDGDVLFLRDSSLLYVYQLGTESLRLGTFNLQTDIYDFEQVEFLPESNRILVAGDTYQYSSRQGIFAEYEYTINNQSFALEIRNSLDRDENEYWDEAFIIVGEDRHYVVVSPYTETAHRFHYSDSSEKFSALNPIDISDFMRYTYFSTTSTFYLYGKLYASNGGQVYSFSLQNSTGVELEFTLDNYYETYAEIVGLSHEQFIFTSERSFTTVYSRTDDSITQLAEGEIIDNIFEISNFNESGLIGIGDGNVTVFAYEEGNLKVKYKESLRNFGGYYDELLLIDDKLIIFFRGLVNEVEFTELEDGSFGHTITSFPILDLDNQLYRNSINRVNVDAKRGHILLSDNEGLSIIEKDGQLYKVTRAYYSRDEAFESVSRLAITALTDTHLFVVDTDNETLSVFDISGSEPILLSQVYDPAIFAANSTIQIDGSKVHVTSNNFFSTFSIDNSGDLQLEVVTPFTGGSSSWFNTGDYYSMELDIFDKINLRQKDMNTGFYRILTTNDVTLSNPVLMATSTRAVIRGRVNNSYNSPVSIRVYDYQRAPVALMEESEVFANQGESFSFDLSSLFSEEDVNDYLEFSSDIVLETLGLQINGNMLETVDPRYFDSEEFKIYATDSNGKSASIDLKTAINRQPKLIQPLPEISVLTGEQATIDLKIYFYDDQDQTLSFALRGEVVDGVDLDEDGVVTISTTAIGDYTVGIDVSDNLGAVNQASLTFSIAQPPLEPTKPVKPASISEQSVSEASSAPVATEPENSQTSGGSTGPALLVLMLSLLYVRRNTTLH